MYSPPGFPYKPDYETVKKRYNSKPMSKEEKFLIFQKIVYSVIISFVIYLLLFPLFFFIMEHSTGGGAMVFLLPGLLVAAPLILLVIFAIVYPIIDYSYKNKKKF